MESSLLCHRCGAVLTLGEGSFYIVRIEARADPTPPAFSGEEMGMDTVREIEWLLDELHDIPEQELMEQVYRRLTLYLCKAGYRPWMGNFAG